MWRLSLSGIVLKCTLAVQLPVHQYKNGTNSGFAIVLHDTSKRSLPAT